MFLVAALLPGIAIATGYFIVFFTSLAWALLRTPVKAARRLLWVSALLTLAIPVAGWLARANTCLPLFGMAIGIGR